MKKLICLIQTAKYQLYNKNNSMNIQIVKKLKIKTKIIIKKDKA